MNEADRIRARHMLDGAQMRSRTSLLAVMKDIEIIGEAANKASAVLMFAEPTIPWGDIGPCGLVIALVAPPPAP